MDELKNEVDVQETQLPEQTGQETLPQPEEQPLAKPIIKVKCSSDAMSAEIEFARIAVHTRKPAKEDIDKALAEKGIVYGINESVIEQLCERPDFNSPVEIAKGVPAQTGNDGYCKYLVETDHSLRPKERSDGTVDYYDLGFIHNVAKGDALCEIHDAEKGADGCNILGIVLEGRFGRPPQIPTGRNTLHDKETNMIISTVDGNVVVNSQGIIDVFDILKIAGNVDNSTGNIFFSGDIFIDKDVASGFKVQTKGNIIVKGTVEGAFLTAGGDISVGEGINGLNHAKITAGGSLKCKYIQNSHIIASGDIFADTIMYCTLECNGSVTLAGKRGALIGGKSVIAKSLSARALGTDSHVATHITMAAVGLQHSEKLQTLKKAIVNMDNELISLIQTMTWCEELMKKGPLKTFQANAYENAKVRQVEILTSRPEKIKELEDAQNELLNIKPDDSFIKCTSHVHTGVRITFGMQVMNVQHSFVNSRVYYLDGEIKTSPM